MNGADTEIVLTSQRIAMAQIGRQREMYLNARDLQLWLAKSEAATTNERARQAMKLIREKIEEVSR